MRTARSFADAEPAAASSEARAASGMSMPGRRLRSATTAGSTSMGFAAVKAQTQLALRRARLFNGKQTHYSASKSSAETSTGLAGAAGCLMRLF